jgi:hypothetical protein
MTVDEILRAIAGAFPAFNAKAMESWAPVFRARLGKHEGAALREAHLEALANFKPSGRTPFPVPVDYEPHLPTGKLNLPKDDGPKLDFQGRAKRAENIYREWRAEQAPRAAQGVPEIMKALEEIAYPIALVMGWNPKTDKLLLSRKQVKVAIQRAISVERRKLHGPPPVQPAAWWGQISAIAEGWKLDITPAWWSDDAAKALEQREAA